MNIKGIFKAAFPIISAAASAGGPLGTMAAAQLGKALGVEKVEDLDQAVANATPEQMLALKNAEQEFALKMAELGFKNAEAIDAIAAGDRDSARKREMTVKDKTPSILAFTVTGGFFGLIFLLTSHSVPEASQGVLNVMLGSLGAAFVGVVSYYFGSSSGSKEKTEILAKAQGK